MEMRRLTWLTVFATMAFLPVLAEEEATEPKEELKAEEKEEGKESVKPSEVDVKETVRVLREIAQKAREEGDAERAERIEARAKAIEEGRVMPQLRGRRGEAGRGRGRREGGERVEPGAEAGPAAEGEAAAEGAEDPEWLQRARESRARMMEERRELLDTIKRQDKQIAELREKTERLEAQLEAVKALLKRLAGE